MSLLKPVCLRHPGKSALKSLKSEISGGLMPIQGRKGMTRRLALGGLLLGLLFLGQNQVQAASNKFLLAVNNNIGPGAPNPYIQAKVTSGVGYWSGNIRYHDYAGFESTNPRYSVQVTWMNQTVTGVFYPVHGRVLEVIVTYNPRRGVVLLPVQR